MAPTVALATTASSRWQRMVAPGVTVAGLAAATVALHLRDPHVEGSWGMCPSALLGIACPGCGGLRAVNDLTDLRVVDAASSNLVFVLALPVVLLVLGRWVVDQWRGTARPADITPLAAVGVGVVLVVFTVLRNLPPFAWLAP